MPSPDVVTNSEERDMDAVLLNAKDIAHFTTIRLMDQGVSMEAATVSAVNMVAGELDIRGSGLEQILTREILASIYGMTAEELREEYETKVARLLSKALEQWPFDWVDDEMGEEE